MTLAVLEKKLKPLSEPVKGRLMQFLLTNFPPQPIQNAVMHKHYSEAVCILLEVLETEDIPAENREAIVKWVKLVSPIIQEFERKANPIPEANPIELLRFLMEQHDLKQADLAGDLGGQPVVSDVLNGKRQLNVDQIKNLSARFHISPASFFTER
jgi:HTH-type transcriptional regulator/antitoxin HigA